MRDDEMKADLNESDLNAIFGTRDDEDQCGFGRECGDSLTNGQADQHPEQDDPAPAADSAPDRLDDIIARLAPMNAVTNIVRTEANGKEKPAETFPLRMHHIKTRLEKQTPGWPARVGPMLFIDDKKHGLATLPKQAALFGWLADKVGKVFWSNGADCVARDDLFAELQRTARQFRAIEAYPHFPPMADHYYSHPPIVAGDGKSLADLIDRFTPQTELDRDLILCLFATAAWGGPPGARPAFAITSPGGRGMGKTSCGKSCGRLFGGLFDISLAEDIGRIKNRLLTPEAATKRCMLSDNIKTSKVSWAELESLITSGEISGHQLYHGEATRPNSLLWMLTLNGPALSRDMAQRCVVIQLGQPEHSATWEEDLNSFIEANRWQIFGDIKAFFEREPSHLTSCSRWGAWERSVLARTPEPAEVQRLIAERQEALDADDSEAANIEDHFAKELAKLGYDPASDSVHVPNEIARAWYGRAIGAPVTTTAATRAVGQAADEKLMKHLRINPCRKHGRGFLWSADNGAAVHYDMDDRLRDNQWQEDRHWDR